MQVIPALNLVGKTKPKQLLALISQAQAVLCPDTGPSHMAAACGNSSVALHAVTNPLISGPYTFPHLWLISILMLCKRCLKLSSVEEAWVDMYMG